MDDSKYVNRPLSDLVKRVETSSLFAGERLKRNVGCEVAHKGFGGEDDEDPELIHKLKKKGIQSIVAIELSTSSKGIAIW
jgi:hypothetical protein